MHPRLGWFREDEPEAGQPRCPSLRPSQRGGRWADTLPLPLPIAGRGNSGVSSRHWARPSSPKVMGILEKGGKTRPPSQALALQPSGPVSMLYLAPQEAVPPPDPLGDHHWEFAHISRILTAAPFYRPEMGSNLPKVSEHSKKWYQNSIAGLPEPKAKFFSTIPTPWPLLPLQHCT